MKLLTFALAVSALQACTPATPPVDALGLPPLPAQTASRNEPARIELGRKLFLDRRLSFNGSMSCAMCHVPEQGFASTASKTAVGIEGKSLRRNAPGLLNVAWQTALFHDGREFSLATQAWLPLLNPDEMANPSIGHVLQRLEMLPDYAGHFERAFDGAGPGMDTLGAAISAFERTLVSARSRFDRWRYGGEAGVLSAVEQQGFALFTGKARCASCHQIGESGALFADGRFHVTGAGQGAAGVAITVPLAPGVQTVLSPSDLAAFEQILPADLGRFEVTQDPADRWAFKTPSLRNVARTPPYMHDGSLPTLAAVVDFYERGGGTVAGKSPLLAPLHLTVAEKAALVAFLGSLDGANLDQQKSAERFR